MVPSGSARDSRLSESVVLRVKITVSLVRPPTKVRTVARADSSASLLTVEVNPAPRWTLLYQGRKLSTASATDCSAGALAA